MELYMFMRISICLLAYVCLPISAQVTGARVITTFAGTEPSFTAERTPRLQVPLGSVSSVFVDPVGTVYFSDPEQFRVFRVDGEGNVATVAGNGIKGYSGDGGPATSASLSLPTAVVADRQGNVLFADGSRVRRISARGEISTFAGGG